MGIRFNENQSSMIHGTPSNENGLYASVLSLVSHLGLE